MKSGDVHQTVLGLDIGPNSIGWAVLTPSKSGITTIKTGVRVFEAGLAELEKDGKGKSRNAERREARQVRRRLERLNRRLIKLGGILQRAGLLPAGELRDPLSRHQLFLELDRRLGSPYKLRARAIAERLEPFELGRALYHICQRRGFRSGRLESSDPDERKGKVKTSISEIEKEMSAGKFSTLGQYLAHVIECGGKVRSKYTSRKMYQDEFLAIWEEQTESSPQILTLELKKNVFKAIFYQRPLKSVAHLIGECDLEPGRKRAPISLLSAQRVRVLCTVNNLHLTNKVTGEKVELSGDQWKLLVEHLDLKGDLTLKQNAKKLLGLKPRDWEFNLERGGETKIPGNRTAAKLSAVFGAERWSGMSSSERDEVVHDLRSFNDTNALKRRGLNHWKLDSTSAEQFAGIQLEPGYSSFSRQAIAKLLPHLGAAKPLQTAIKEKYPDRWNRKGSAHTSLPPLDCDDMPDLRNPIVSRALSELRQIVNALIVRYGKPDIIRVELARDLRQSAKQRKETTDKIRANEKARDQARLKIIQEAGISEPKPSDILKFQLFEECGGICPYTGQGISFSAMFGQHPQVDFEHIIPFERCLDKSYMNKTLCYSDENRNVKHKRTPWEAYHGTGKWDDILSRVHNFKGTAAKEKFRRFKMEPAEVKELIDSFTSRQLNDTRYASKLAKQYLGLLYGGAGDDGIDSTGTRRIFCSSGSATAFFRYEWGLHAILGDGGQKSRDDHRHHAVDAVVIALTDPASVKALSDAASRTRTIGRRLFDKMQPPWSGFLDDVRTAVDQTIPVHRVSRRVRGSLHAQTFYGKPRTDDKGATYCHQRVPVEKLTEKDIAHIVDPSVRDAIKKRLAEPGGLPMEAFKEKKNHPFLVRNGRQIRIHRVRIRRNLHTVAVGEGFRTRHVMTDSNHHMEIWAKIDANGNDTEWKGRVISMLEAHRRKRAGEPIVRRDHGPGTRFVFSLFNKDVIELGVANAKRDLFVVRTIPESKQVRWVHINEARPLKEVQKPGQTGYPETLRRLNCRKMVVTPLGEVRTAND